MKLPLYSKRKAVGLKSPCALLDWSLEIASMMRLVSYDPYRRPLVTLR